MNAELILGCHGARRFGFNICRGVSNTILDLRKIKDREAVIEHLDNHYKLFEAIIEDRNQVYNLINYIETEKLVPKHTADLLYEFLAMHKGCGHYALIETIK